VRVHKGKNFRQRRTSYVRCIFPSSEVDFACTLPHADLDFFSFGQSFNDALSALARQCPWFSRGFEVNSRSRRWSARATRKPEVAPRCAINMRFPSTEKADSLISLGLCLRVCVLGVSCLDKSRRGLFISLATRYFWLSSSSTPAISRNQKRASILAICERFPAFELISNRFSLNNRGANHWIN